uniref:Uncharacterized protein n=1 Tax=Rhizophora mucronata TaxID=61149 RepID=A0A2P2PG70_RHIMU
MHLTISPHSLKKWYTFGCLASMPMVTLYVV